MMMITHILCFICDCCFNVGTRPAAFGKAGTGALVAVLAADGPADARAAEGGGKLLGRRRGVVELPSDPRSIACKSNALVLKTVSMTHE